MLQQIKNLYVIFDKKQTKEINQIIEEIINKGENYKTINLWKFNQTIGGIGGYCQGCNPSLSNPFQGTEFRNIYRCLQYARSDFDLCNINDVARYTIENCGHHLEETIKLFLKKNNFLLWVTTNRYPLGKLLEHIERKKILEEGIINQLKLFIDIYNISKHEILSNDELDRTFHVEDAIICYFACRIVGKEILMQIDKERAMCIYEIDWNNYERKVHF